jgi:ATP-dependent Zn protease
LAKPTSLATLKRPPWLLPLTSLLLLILLWYSFQHPIGAPNLKQTSYSEFLSEVRKGHVSEVRIDEQRFMATLKTDAAKKETAQQISTQRLPGMDETSLLKDLEDQQVTFSGVESSWWGALLPWLVPILFFVFIFGYGNR